MKRLAMLILFLFMLGPTVGHADFYDAFDGSFNANWSQQEYDNRVDVSTAKVRAGSHSVKFYWVDTDDLVSGGRRAELKLNNNSIAVGNEIWYGVSIYDVAEATYPTWNLMNQWHGSVSGPSPILALQNGAGTYKFVRRNVNTTTPSTTTYNLSAASTYENAWHDWVVHAKLHAGGLATLQVYLDGTSVLGPYASISIGYADDPSYYWKMGIYLSSGYTGNLERYMDEFRLKTSGGSYDLSCPTIHPKAPGITAPTPGQNEVSSTPTITATFSKGYTDAARSHIRDVQGVFAHHYTDWKITTDEAGANIVTSSLKDSTNLLSWTSGALSYGTTYYVHVRHWVRAGSAPGVDRNFDGAVNDSDRYEGPWASVQFTTVNPPGGGQGYFTLDPDGTGEITLDPSGTGEVTLTN